jgi:hypothetical protein
MNMIKLLKLCCFVFVAATLSQCNKLEEKVYSQNTEDNFFQSLNDVRAAVTGMYRPMQQCCGGYEQSAHFVLNGTSDEGTGQGDWGTYDRLDYTASSAGDVGGIWGSSYQAIAGANLVIDNEEKINAVDNSSDKNIAKAAVGEAKFWRAVNYFQLVQMFGGVPLRTTQTKRADQTIIEKSTEEEVYAQIIADFIDAEQKLPSTQSSGKVSKWAASAYLAKVYLTKKDYANALTKATEVINNGPYSLAPKFKDVFDIDKKNGPEDIFAIQYVRVDGQGMRLGSLTGGWGITGIESNLYSKYSPIDDRRNTTFADPGNPASNQGKWLDPLAVSADGQGNNFIVYRYADLVLVKAEAENEISGPTTAAYAEINKVRNRALLPNLTPGLTKAQFSDSLLKERNLELALEEVRWFDLKRTGKLKSTLVADGVTWNDKYYLFPIPQSDIDASNGILTQNPGY